MNMLNEGLELLNQPTSTSVQAGTTDGVTPVYVHAGNILSILFGLLGALLMAYVMWFFGWTGIQTGLVDKMLILEEAALGFVLLAAITFVASGSASYYLNNFLSHAPSATHFWEFGAILQSFDMYVIVHSVKNTTGPSGCDGFWRTQGDLFLEVQCGRAVHGEFHTHKNGPKRTCVSKIGVFEEEFHFIVTPTDETCRFTLKDQNVVGDELLGQCDVDLGEEVLTGWPQQKAYRMHAKAKYGEAAGESRVAGTMVVSFIPGDNFPKRALDRVKARNGLAYSKLEAMQQKRREKFNLYQTQHGYGTWDTAAQA